VFAELVAVDMVRTRAGHQVASHIADGDDVLMAYGRLVALIDDFIESGTSMSKENYLN
jgi:hypothetical protein